MFGLTSLGLRKPSHGLIGIDIASTSVKLVELSRQGTVFHVDSCATHPLPEGAVVERRIQNAGEVTEAVRLACVQARPLSRNAAVAVPASNAISKILTFPRWLSDDEIAARIQYESDKHLPFPFTEVAFDFHRLDRDKQSDATQDVLLVACRQKYVDQLINIVEGAGLEPVRVDIDTFAMERLLAETYSTVQQSTACVALIDIGATRQAFHALQGRRIIYSRDSVTDEQPHTDTLVRQIGHSLQLYYAAGAYPKVERLLLAGGASLVPGLAQQLSAESGMPADILHPFSGMTLNPRLDMPRSLADKAPAMLTACGLAMRVTA